MKQCLIVVDYQNDFVDGALGFPEAASLEDAIAAKITAYRERGDDIIFTLDTHGDDYLETEEGKNLPVPHCLIRTLGHELYGKIKILREKKDKCFPKSTFGSDDLLGYLKKTPYQSIELIGIVSNICVIANAILAKTAQPETPILVDAACTASNDQHLNRAALTVMKSMHIKILND